MLRTRLTTKLTLAVSLVSTFIILIAAIVVSTFYYYASEKDIQNYLLDQAQTIITEQVVYNQNQIMYRPGPRGENLATRLSGLGISALILDSRLTPIATYGIYNAFPTDKLQEIIRASNLSQVAASQKPRFTHVTSQDGRIYESFALPILSDNQIVATIQLAKETPIISRILPLNLMLLAFILPLVAVFNGLVVGWLMRRSLKPLNQLIDHLRRVSPNQIPQKIDLSGQVSDEVSQAAHTFNDLLDEVGASVAKQKDFVAHASHELKTPLTAAISSLDLALSFSSSSSPSYKYISQTKSNLYILNQTITSLLTLSRLSSAAGHHLTSPPYSIHPALQKIISLHRGGAAQKGLTLHLDCPDHLQTSLPPEHLQIILSNLLDNAVKFSHPNSLVTIACLSAPAHLNLTVTDTGPGMTADEISQIFNRFYRGRASRTSTGSGLGLSIVKLICDLHHLPVKVTSQPDQGTTVTLHLPI